MYDFVSKINRKKKYAAKWMVKNTKGEEYSEDIVPLSVADMEFKIMDEVKEALHHAIDEYDPFGYQCMSDAYLVSICKWMLECHYVEVQKDWIVITSGVVEALINSVKTFAHESEGVIIFTPVYPPFYKAASSANTLVQECPFINENETYRVNFELFEKLAQNQNNTMLLLCSPHNPVGKVFTKDELDRIIQICKDNDIFIVADEIHHDIVMPQYKHTCLLQYLDEYDKMIVCTSASKSFNLAGMKLSNIIIPNAKLREAFVKDDHQVIHPFSMVATQTAYECGEKWLHEMIEVVYHNYQIACDFFHQYYPKASYSELQGTYLMWVNMNAYFDHEDQMIQYLYDDASFIVNQGSTFGVNGTCYMRINLALPCEELKKALHRLIQE